MRNFVVINGDTYIDYSLEDLVDVHLKNKKKNYFVTKKN